MPTSASASDTSISMPPSPAQANASCSTSKNTGSRNVVQPAGLRRHPDDQAEQGRRDGEEDERHGHDRRALVDVRLHLGVGAVLAAERQEDEAEHVDAGEQHDEQPDAPRPRTSRR